MLNRVTVLVLGSVLAAAPALAATQGILGKKFLVKDTGVPANAKIVVLGKELGSPNTVVGNPVANGATLRVLTYGATDELGYLAVEDPVHVHDLHATVLYLLGIDHKRLTFRHRGRDFRLTDEFGNVAHGILT